ncbi:unnamed protein product [Sphenostylis stenocarpa]|uniref:Glycosyltransferase n=1 Tax=Sphenostylis stenocarpa TaxID=92480 RepID=A0AA86RTU5_9FABA|nr:unnamed protein product [Sphenostylis stenocarpa]
MDSTPLCNLHFVFIPIMSSSHLLPMVDMAKMFARRKVKVSIVTTPLNSIHFQASIDREIHSGSPIQILHVQFPWAEAGLPEGCESADTLLSMDLLSKFTVAMDLLQRPIEELLQNQSPFPSCIIADQSFTCMADVVDKLHVPRIIFNGRNCFFLLCCHILQKDKVHEDVSYNEKFLVPGMPDRIELRRSQLPGILQPGTDLKLQACREATREAAKKAYGIVVNSFEELEPKYLEEYERLTEHKVWCVGPVSLCNKDDIEKGSRSKRNSSDESKYVKWLDSWPARSVIYVCLGSLNRVIPEQLIELGLGLEATKRPFIWVLRGAYGREEIEKWLLEDGFEERVKGRGILIKGWVPQVLILSHRAIGAFLTHCGWNSTLEGICAGVPLVTFPLFSEQFLNEKVVVQVVGNGVSLGAESVVHLGEEDKARVQVRREKIADSIEKVMGEGKEKEVIRETARNYAAMARKTIEEGGSSYNNMSMLIKDIARFKMPKKM